MVLDACGVDPFLERNGAGALRTRSVGRGGCQGSKMKKEKGKGREKKQKTVPDGNGDLVR